MRLIIKNFSGAVAFWIPVKILVRLTGQNVLLPFYHTVSDESLPHIRHLYNICSVKKFTRDLDFFLKTFNPVSFSELMRSLTGSGGLNKPVMALSFDDGLREFDDIIAPILLQKGIPATLFINPAFVDNNALFYKYKASLILDRLMRLDFPKNLREIIGSRFGITLKSKKTLQKAIQEIRYDHQDKLDSIAELLDINFSTFLKVKQPYLSLEQLKQMIGKGFQVGAHSHDHPMFSHLTLDEQLKQACQSVEWVVRTFKLNYRYFAFPFTDTGVGEDFFNTVYHSGERIIDLSFGTSGLKKEKYPFHFQRIPMEASRLCARLYLRGEYMYYMLKGLAGRNVMKR